MHLSHGAGWGTYREPGEHYLVNNETSPYRQKYFDACVDRHTGEDQKCTVAAGEKYVKCIHDCRLELCKDEETASCVTEDLIANATNAAQCQSITTTKWCRQYEIADVTAENEGTLGFVPRTYYCHDSKGLFTGEPGRVVKSGFLEEHGSTKIKLGDCTYEYGARVERSRAGDYAYCDGAFCDNTFDGGYRSRDYDPRYRSWYTQTKDMQLPNWSPPYPFFSELDLGITFSHPIYSEDTELGRYVFEGVLGVDYTFSDIGRFLQEEYLDSSTIVVVFEEEEPNYIVASSTGRNSATKVLAADESKPCPDSGSSDTSICAVAREQMSGLSGSPDDDLLVKAYKEQLAQGYPRDLLTFKLDDDNVEDDLYIMQSTKYRPGGDLKWIILVISPSGKASADAITTENSLFGLVCVVASLGFLLCLAMFTQLYRKRQERAIILADWRFTLAFLLGCALLNISSFTLLGENTEALCLTRMWAFHFLFALALSPLFVKVWRMWRMAGTPNRPSGVDNSTAALLSLPIVAFQTLILLIFTFVDPPQPKEIIDFEEGIILQSIVCSQNSNAFVIVVTIYEASLILVGCVLAYVTRNLDSQLGEAKPLMFSMYNIAFIGSITTVILYTMKIDGVGRIMLRTIGTFWGTVFSSAAFVLPRLMRVTVERKRQLSVLKIGSNPPGDPLKDQRGRVRFSEYNSTSIFQENAGDSDEAESKSNKKKLSKTGSQVDDSFRVATGWSEFERPGEEVAKNSLHEVPKRRSIVNSFFESLRMTGSGWSIYEIPASEVSKFEEDKTENREEDNMKDTDGDNVNASLASHEERFQVSALHSMPPLESLPPLESCLEDIGEDIGEDSQQEPAPESVLKKKEPSTVSLDEEAIPVSSLHSMPPLESSLEDISDDTQQEPELESAPKKKESSTTSLHEEAIPESPRGEVQLSRDDIC